MNRRFFAAALAALPFVGKAEAATVQDIHALQPDFVSAFEREGVIKEAMTGFADPDHASLIGKVYGFYGTPLTATQEARTAGQMYWVYFEEINL